MSSPNPQGPQPGQQPPQPQQPQGQQGQQAVDWSKLQQLLQQAVAHAPQIYQAVLMLLTILNGGTPPAQATAAVKCGPDGSDDAGECCRGVINAQVQALALAVQCAKCCDGEQGGGTTLG